MNWKKSEIVFGNRMMRINGVLFLKHPFETKEEIFEVVEQYLNGMPNAMIKRIYRVEKNKLKCIRKAMGLPIQHGGCPLRGIKLEEKKKYKERIYKDVLSGMDTLEIAKKYNRSRQYINLVKREGNKCNTKK